MTAGFFSAISRATAPTSRGSSRSFPSGASRKIKSRKPRSSPARRLSSFRRRSRAASSYPPSRPSVSVQEQSGPLERVQPGDHQHAADPGGGEPRAPRGGGDPPGAEGVVHHPHLVRPHAILDQPPPGVLGDGHKRHARRVQPLLPAVRPLARRAAVDHVDVGHAAPVDGVQRHQDRRVLDARGDEHERPVLPQEPPDDVDELAGGVERLSAEAHRFRLLQCVAGRRDEDGIERVAQSRGGGQRHPLGAVEVAAVQDVEQRKAPGDRTDWAGQTRPVEASPTTSPPSTSTGSVSK